MNGFDILTIIIVNLMVLGMKTISITKEILKRIYILHFIVTFVREFYTLHPAIGYEMPKQISFYSDISPYILYHHERYDGGGYLENRKAEEIPLESRIIALTESFDSMVSKITYKSRKTMNDAIDELIINRGKQFDPAFVGLFVKNIREPID